MEAAKITVRIEIENEEEIKATLQEIHEAIEKANSLIDELASKDVSINLRMK